MLAGLQGSGKTTTAGKLAKMSRKGQKRPMMIADTAAPAASISSITLGQQIGVEVYNEDGSKTVRVAKTV